MNNKKTKGPVFSRRGILPILGGSLLFPFISMAKPALEVTEEEEEAIEYKTLLKPDGTAVKVKVSSLKNAKVVKKNISNKSFLNWLGKKI